MSSSLLVSSGALLVSAVAMVISGLAYRETKRARKLAITPSVTGRANNDPPGRYVKHWIEATNGGGLARNIVCTWGLTSHPDGPAPASGVEDKISQLAPGASHRLRETTERLFVKWATIICEDAKGGRHWSRYDEQEGQNWRFGSGDPPTQ